LIKILKNILLNIYLRLINNINQKNFFVLLFLFFFMQNDNSLAHSHQNSRLHHVTLAQMVSQTIWRLSESTVIQWEPKYLNETVNEMLESIDTSRFQVAKGIFYFL